MTNENGQHNWYAVIPAEILLDKTLSSTQKLLIALISNLSNAKGYCYASNSYLAECLNLTAKTISDNVTLLENKGIIVRDIIRNPKTQQIERRQLRIKALPLIFRMPIRKNRDTPPPKNTESNNKVYKNKDNRDDTLKKIVI